MRCVSGYVALDVVPRRGRWRLILTYLFVVAGPDRPVPEEHEARTEQKKGYAKWEAGPSKAAEATAASAERTKNNLYDRLHSAVSERG
jgi:hypothetical protein